MAAAALLLVSCSDRPPAGEADPERNAPVVTTDGVTSPEDTSTDEGAGGDEGAVDLPEGRDVVVTSITDGDTFRAGDERIRLIGIDTPEVSGEVECYGPEATDALSELIPVGTEVRLVADVEPIDRYDRTLAYVHRSSDGADVGLALLAAGVAEAVVYEPNVARADTYAAADAAARTAAAGMWSACPGAGGGSTTIGPTTPPETSGATTTPPSTSADPAGCDPSYPDVCIPPSPPDLDCSDIPHRRFRVLPPDPHRFDDASGTGNGIGCESD